MHVLAGITKVDHAGNVVEQRQFHGRVARASTAEGVILQTASGEEIWLPPDFDSYHPADPGEYRLRSTGEVVVNPDYTATWTVWPPDRH